MSPRIPIYKPFLNDNVKNYVNDCIDSTWISSKGEYVRKFEDAVASYIGGVEATSCSNGTVALHLALVSMGIEAGDEVIIPTFTYVATANAIRYVGGIPVFVDSEEGSWNLSVSEIEKAVSPKTKAILCVHIYGVPCDLKKIVEVASKHNLKIIEDCAEAIGSFIEAEHVGKYSDVATFSFFGNKTITTGEGGMVCSKHSVVIDEISHLKNQAVSKEKVYWHDQVGFNYRLTNIASAIGLAQMEIVNEILERKEQVLEWYKASLDDYRVCFQTVGDNDKSSNWLVVVCFDSKEIRSRVEKKLEEANIEIRPAFPLITDMPPYQIYSRGSYPVAEKVSQNGLCLPSYPELDRPTIDIVCQIIGKALNGV